MKKLVIILFLLIGCNTIQSEQPQKIHTLKISINQEVRLLQVINSNIITKGKEYNIIAHSKHPTTLIGNFTIIEPHTLKLKEVIHYIK